MEATMKFEEIKMGDRSTRLGIKEVLVGKHEAVRLSRSAVSMNAKGEKHIKYEGPENEQLKEMGRLVFENFCASLPPQQAAQMKALTLNLIELKKDNGYLYEGYVLDSALLTMTGGRESHVSLKYLSSFALAIGLVPPSIMSLPLSMVIAIDEDDEETFKQLAEKISQYPSEYGSPNTTPKRKLVVTEYRDIEEKEFEWPLS